MAEVKIIGIGTSGLIGSRIAELLPHREIKNLSLETGIDITNPVTLDAIRNDVEHGIVLHLAAKADVDGCERDKPLGENGLAWKINVDGTRNVIEACKKNNKKVIYISTDFVFDGENTPPDGYSEEDIPNPINWYAKTKCLGEEIVINSGLSYLIVRLAYPYRKDEFSQKRDFVHAMLAKLRTNQPISVVTDHMICPTFVDDIAYALDALIQNNAEGVYHVVGSQALSPYDTALLMAERFGFDKHLITPTTRKEYFKDKAPRPFNLTLKNDKIQRLGVKMVRFEEGVKEVES